MNSLPKPNFKILDGLRGIAATYVVINHCRGNLLIGGKEYSAIKPIKDWSILEKLYYATLQLTSLGREFVIFFFVLSGFSIAHSLINTTKITGFYQRRLIRLYPPYIAALLWAYFVFIFINSITPSLVQNQLSVFATPSFIINNLLYIPHGSLIAQFWSLTHEVLFYLIIPLAFFYRPFYYIISVLLFIAGWFISYNTFSSQQILLSFIFDYNIYFAVGVLLYFNYNTIESHLLFNKKNIIIISMTIFILMTLIKFKTNEDNKITLILSALLSLILIINFQQKKVTNKLLTFLGNMSYTVYITHLASIFLFKSLLLKSGLVNSIVITNKGIWIAGILFCIIISFCIYQVSERPTKIFLKYLRIHEEKNASLYK